MSNRAANTPSRVPSAKLRTTKPQVVRAAGSKSAGTVIGRAGMIKINAVEGLRLTPTMKAALEEFDSKGLTADQRRREIIRRFAK